MARKSIVATKKIRKGVTGNNLTTKRPGNGLSPMRWDDIIVCSQTGTATSCQFLRSHREHGTFVILSVFSVCSVAIGCASLGASIIGSIASINYEKDDQVLQKEI